MVYPVQVGSSFIITNSHVPSSRTECQTIDPPETEGPGKVLEDRQCLKVDNLDSSVFTYTRHGQHLSAGVEPDVVNLSGEVEDSFLWPGLGGGGESVPGQRRLRQGQRRGRAGHGRRQGQFGRQGRG